MGALAGAFVATSGAATGALADAGGRADTADWLAAVATLEVDGLARPSGDWVLDLPRDHAPHAEAASEVWQLAAHLEDAEGHPVGLQLSLFRLALTGPEAPATGSGWGLREIYRGHAVLTDGAAPRSFGQERFGRGMDRLAGFEAETGELRLDGWVLRFGATAEDIPWQLEAGAGNLRVTLRLTAEGAPLGSGGSDAPFRGYALPRLRAEGTLVTPEGRRDVTGVAWFEHLWGELPLPGAGPVATDRLLLQLDDGTALSLLRSRRTDGRGVPTLEGVVIEADGAVRALDDGAASVELTRHWQGGEGAHWPVGWTLRLGELELEVAPVLDDQEHAFATRVWSGLVRAEGRRGDRPVTGSGTLQLMGHGD